MSQSLIAQLEKMIERLQDEKECYQEENNNRVDEHSMFIVGHIRGIEECISLIKG